MCRFSFCSRRHKLRHGTVYVAVLGVAMIVSVIGASALHMARIELRELESLEAMARARLAARSGVECVLAQISKDPLWRTTYSTGVSGLVAQLSNMLAGGDSFSFTLSDVDGDLNDNNNDSVTLRCVGESGAARHVVEVLLQPSGEGLDCLAYSVHSHGNMDVDDTVTTSQTLSTNTEFLAHATVNGNVRAGTSISGGGNISGAKFQNQTQLDMPDPATVFDYYITNGTPISYVQLGGGKIDKSLLSNGNNPFGTGFTNMQGIYVINCQGSKVIVKDSRIRGTLVFLNATQGVEIDGCIHWEPVVPNFPAMLVQGNVLMKWDATKALSETAIGRNLNPPNTPYMGSSDGDTGDTYSGTITGLIYCTGDMKIDQSASFSGVMIVGGIFEGKKTVNMSYDSMYYYSAPPGFTAGTNVELVPGTWKQVAF